MAEGELVGAKRIAAMFGITERRVRQLAQDGVIPRTDRGRYELDVVVAAYVSNLQDKLGRGGSGTTVDNLNEERTRLTKANADKTEMELSVMRGEYLPAAEVLQTWTAQLAAFRAKILAVPIKLATELTGIENRKEIQAITERYMHESLTEMAVSEGPDSENFGVATDREIGSNVTAKPKRNRKRVGRPKKEAKSGA